VAIVAPDEVVLDDRDAGIKVTITGGTATGWRFGAIWPAAELTDEGCLKERDVCHSLPAAGGLIPYCDGTDYVGTEACTGIPELYYREGAMTFVLIPAIGTGCWVWGDDADYYDAFHCEKRKWDPSSY
jgi:hypothetical protein